MLGATEADLTPRGGAQFGIAHHIDAEEEVAVDPSRGQRRAEPEGGCHLIWGEPFAQTWADGFGLDDLDQHRDGDGATSGLLGWMIAVLGAEDPALAIADYALHQIAEAALSVGDLEHCDLPGKLVA